VDSFYANVTSTSHTLSWYPPQRGQRSRRETSAPVAPILPGRRLDGGHVGLQAECHPWCRRHRAILGDAARHRFRKGQLEGVATGDVLAQPCGINRRFELAAEQALTDRSSYSHAFLPHHLICCTTLLNGPAETVGW